MKRKVIVILASLLFILSDFNVSMAKEDENKNTMEGVIISAQNCLNFLYEQGNKEWENCVLGDKMALFNNENEIVAYYILVQNCNKNKGYIILNAEKPYNVIEYSFNKDNFIEEAKLNISKQYCISQKKQKVFYLGGLTYVIGGEDNRKNEKFINISTNALSSVSKDDLEEIEKSASKKTPDSGSSFITAPSIYESGYTSKRVKTISNGLIDYKLMSDFSKGSVCAPTAAVNYMYYWYKRDYKKYKKLCPKSWFATYSKLFLYMKTSNKNGTKDADVANAYKNYIRDCGFKVTTSFHKGTNEGNDIVKEIDKNRPCHLILHDHYKYGDHSVLAVGYQQYGYKQLLYTRYETYIRIVDGWTKRPTRYVWGGCKGNWNFVSISLG